ncbi:hypothetical protein ESCO_002203 [Escovopsis weberi]|uniref:Peptidyl-tRNA hydrolase n=1 Tax=Escovopsis weberi TaxID=150374 RepID=A0A0N0RU23_ESCWE|nr:hypothetical protein ESCO_002203 [Escovopsis weberi]
MRFSAAATIALLPGLSAAQDSPLSQYTAQFQQAMTQLVSRIPNPGRFDPVAAAAAKDGPMKLSVLSLENWKDTLYEPVAPDAETPMEWWVMVTGRNKTCFGHCGRFEEAFNETAAKFAELDDAPRMAVLNCDDQPILCNSWTATAGNIWAFQMLPAPAPVDVYKKKFNLTSVTADDLAKLQAGDKTPFALVDSWFHPINGKATELGLSVPFAYIVWTFNLVPQWALMLVVSLVSRTMMSNRVTARADKQAATVAQKKTK